MRSINLFMVIQFISLMVVLTSNAQNNMAASLTSGVSYTVSIKGIEDDDLAQSLRQYSRTVELQQRPPASVEHLRRRATEDLDRLKSMMQANGFFGATLEVSINSATRPVLVTFQIEPGPLYQLKQVRLNEIHQSMKKIPPPTIESLGLKLNETVQTDDIFTAQRRIIQYYNQKSFPFTEVSNQRVEVNHQERSVFVTYTIQIGPRAFFGDTEIRGLESLDEQYVRNRIMWTRGAHFDASLIDQTQLKLIRSNLFSVVRIEHATAVTDNNDLPMILELSERKPRTVSTGAFYNTDNGPGGQIGWQHRNLFGGGESLSTEINASMVEYLGFLEYRQPDFLDIDQFLILRAEIAYDQPDAYTSRNQTTSAIIERYWDDDIKISTGVSYRLAEVSQLDTRSSFGLFSLPTEFYWDYSNNLLNPTSGGRMQVSSEPFYDTLGNADMFWKNYFKYSHYYQLTESPTIILAGRVGVGSIIGDTLFDIPADERYYAGGSNSIRGYPYKTVSPLVTGHPVGGLSIIEMSFEVRWNFTESMGLVGFIDAGNAFDSNFPDFSEDLLWGAGAGFRYYTPIGPFRIDVGFPLSRRDHWDDSFELYMSIGQAF